MMLTLTEWFAIGIAAVSILTTLRAIYAVYWWKSRTEILERELSQCQYKRRLDAVRIGNLKKKIGEDYGIAMQGGE